MKQDIYDKYIVEDDLEKCIVTGKGGFSVDYSDWDLTHANARLQKGAALRNRSVTPRILALFIVYVSEFGVYTKSALACGETFGRLRRYIDTLPAVKEAFDEANEYCTDMFELEANRRAFEGFDSPVFWAGLEVGTVRKFSDPLAIAILKKRRSAFKENGEEQQLSESSGVLVVGQRAKSTDDWSEKYKQ